MDDPYIPIIAREDSSIIIEFCLRVLTEIMIAIMLEISEAKIPKSSMILDVDSG